MVLAVCLFGPDAHLDFSDVLSAKHPFGDSVDTDAAAHAINELAIAYLLVVLQFACLIPGTLHHGLVFEGLSAHSDAHGAQFKGSPKSLIPYKDVTV